MKVALAFGVCEPGNLARDQRRDALVSPLILILVLLLVLAAIGGGVWLSNLLWLVFIVALVVLLVGFLTGRRAV